MSQLIDEDFIIKHIEHNIMQIAEERIKIEVKLFEDNLRKRAANIANSIVLEEIRTANQREHILQIKMKPLKRWKP